MNLKDLKVGDIIEAKFCEIHYLAEIIKIDPGHYFPLVCLVPRDLIYVRDSGWEMDSVLSTGQALEERQQLPQYKKLQHKFWVLRIHEVVAIKSGLQW